MEAGREIGCVPTVVADSGVENVNEQVDELVKAGVLNRILALIEVAFSNSMIEACWRSLCHQWLYLHMLDSLGSVKRSKTAQEKKYEPVSGLIGGPEAMYSSSAFSTSVASGCILIPS